MVDSPHLSNWSKKGLNYAATEDLYSCHDTAYKLIEKFVTEKAYDNPKFVEDLVRDVSVYLKNLVLQNKISKYSVESENFESIHNHSAFAKVGNNF